MWHMGHTSKHDIMLLFLKSVMRSLKNAHAHQ
jgi:hypothetical protein